MITPTRLCVHLVLMWWAFPVTAATFPSLAEDPFTISAWIKTSDNGTVFSRCAPAGRWSPGGKTLFLRNGALAYDIGWVGVVRGGTRLDDNRWHHIAFIGARPQRAYVDGKLDLNGDLQPRPDGDGHVFKVGYTAPDFGGAFEGLIDDVAVYDRVLTAAEIQALARGEDAALPGLVARWPFDDSDKDVVSDHQVALTGPPSFQKGKVGPALKLDGGFQRPRREPGVRFRLYWVGEPLFDHARLLPDQSPNVDVTIPSFELGGDESAFTNQGTTYDQQYVLLLESDLRVPQAGTYQFQIAGDGWLRVRIGSRDVIRWNRPRGPKHSRAEVRLDQGSVPVELTQNLGSGDGRATLRWKRPGSDRFESISPSELTANSFYFRPTSGARKRLSRRGDRPGKRQKLAGPHPGMDLTTIHPDGVEVPVGGLATFPDGRLVVATFDARRLRAPRPQEEPDGQLWIWGHPHADGLAKFERRLIADDLYEPSGVCVVGEAIYVSQRHEVTRFDHDGVSARWKPTAVATGWETNDFHAISFGLLHEPGADGHLGFLYMAKGTGLGLMRNPSNHGSVWRIDLAKPVGGNVEPLTGGHRTPNGLGFGPEGRIYVTDNQGEYTPANELNLVERGRFYGFYHRTDNGGFASPFQNREDRLNPGKGVTEAAVWLPQDEIANSPSEPVLIPEGWPYAGQILVGDVKYGGVNRVFLEKVDNVWQGAAFRFTQGLEAGINRLAFGPDGSLYVGGIGGVHASTWNWVDPQGRKTFQGLQRLRPNGIRAFDLECVSAIPGGFRISFTKPVDIGWLESPRNYTVRQWTYQAKPQYGGPKVDQRPLIVESARGAADGRSVELQIPGLESSYCIYFLVDPVSTDGDQIWSTEAWYTLKQLAE